MDYDPLGLYRLPDSASAADHLRFEPAAKGFMEAFYEDPRVPRLLRAVRPDTVSGMGQIIAKSREWDASTSPALAEQLGKSPALRRERAAITTAMRHLLDAVKSGRATDTLLAELAAQEERAKALDRQLAALDAQRHPVSLDSKRLAARLQELGRDVRGVLAQGAPAVRRLVLQRVLNGRRVACEPFREPGRRGYRFRATGSYAGMLFTDMCGPNGIRTRV